MTKLLNKSKQKILVNAFRFVYAQFGELPDGLFAYQNTKFAIV
jgi:hypothetical protein